MGLKFVKPLRSYSAAGSGERPEKTAMQLALTLRYSSVQSNAVANSSYRWTRALRVPTLPMLSCVLWPEDIRNFVPYSTLGGVWQPKQCCRFSNLEEPVPLRVERCSTDIRDFHSKRNVVQRHSTLDKTGAVFWQRKVRADATSYLQNSTAFNWPTCPRNR